IEETFRFVKQSYQLEDIRVMRYQRLKNLVLLLTAAAYFATAFLGQKLKLRILCEKLLIISQRFFGIPPFRFYALADGICNILSRSSARSLSEYSEIVSQKHNGLCATWNQATTCSTKSDYSDTLLARLPTHLKLLSSSSYWAGKRKKNEECPVVFIRCRSSLKMSPLLPRLKCP